jgi:hypothetical protein
VVPEMIKYKIKYSICQEILNILQKAHAIEVDGDKRSEIGCANFASKQKKNPLFLA